MADYETVIRSNDFGGASVTIPHKEAIIPYLDEVRGPAGTIGAVNTIVPEWDSLGSYTKFSRVMLLLLYFWLVIRKGSFSGL